MIYVAFDTETYLIGAGRLAPRLVCASVHDGVRTELLAREDALERFDELLRADVCLVMANGAFDMGVMAQAGADMTAIFDCYEAGRVWDVQTWDVCFF